MAKADTRIFVLVGERGASGPIVKGRARTTLRAQCIAWIDEAGTVRREPLTVEITAPTSKYFQFSRKLAYFHTAELRGHLSRRRSSHVFVESSVARGQSRQLGRILDEIRPLSEINDAVLGKLRFKAADYVYSKRMRFGGRLITLSIEAYTREGAAKTLVVARQTVNAAASWLAWLKRHIARELLDHTNTTWREGMKPLTASGLAKHIALRTVHVNRDKIELDCSVKNDLFGGHFLRLLVSRNMDFIDWDFIG